MKKNYSLILGTSLLAIAVMLGAFGAHGLEKTVGAKELNVFETGVRYHFYHGFALILLGFYEKMTASFFPKLRALMVLSIGFFSFNCYLYAITSQKIFGMLVPIGGIGFIVFWVTWCSIIFKESKI